MHAPLNPIVGLAIVLVTSFHVSCLGAVQIVAHRGASYDAPENTVTAFLLGWQQQADAIELDIRLTSDRQVVVIHDGDTKRTTGTSGAVAKRTLADLRRLDAGGWKDPRWKGEKIPTLAEALKTMPDGKRAFIEIKCGPEVLPVLEGVLRDSGKKPDQLVLIGFDYATMAQAKKTFPGLEVCWVVGAPDAKKKQKTPDLSTLIEKAKAAGLDGLDLDFHFPIDSSAVANVKRAGLKLYVWTVDDAAAARRLAAAGVDGITTNRPAWLRGQLKDEVMTESRPGT